MADSIASFMRKLLSRYKNHILSMTQDTQIHEYLTNEHQMFQEMVTAAYLPDPGVIDFSSVEQKWGKKVKFLLLDFCKVVCQLYLDMTINGCSNFTSKLNHFSKEAISTRDKRISETSGESQYQRSSFLNEANPDEFKRIVSDFGSNPFASAYGIENSQF